MSSKLGGTRSRETIARLFAGVAVIALALSWPTVPASATGGTSGRNGTANPDGGSRPGGNDGQTGQGGNGTVGWDNGGGGGGGAGWPPGAGGDGGSKGTDGGGGHGGSPGGSAGTIDGGPGEDAGGGDGGGGGGGGLHGFVGNAAPTTDSTGGNGGKGGNGGGSHFHNGGGGGGGGAGGYGASVSASGFGNVDIDVNISGGHGGNGGDGGYYGVGGDGGTGGYGLLVGGNATITIGASWTVTGGTGGNGGGGGGGGGGAKGGMGLFVSSPSTITNNGKINGGAGGHGSDPGTDGTAGDGVSFTGPGGTLTNTGTITGGTAGSSGMGGNGVWIGPGITMTNSGTINGGAGGKGGAGVALNSGSTLTNSGTINGGTGGGSAVLADSATVFNSNHIVGVSIGYKKWDTAITFTGSGNRLELWAKSRIDGDIDAWSSKNDTLAWGGTDDETFHLNWNLAQYQGFEAYEKTGAGTWSFVGDGSIAGAMTVSEGALLVNGTFGVGSITVAQGGTLGGSGTIAGPVSAGGTIAPGSSIGTLTVTGDVDLAASSNLSVEIDADQNASDLLNVTGKATLEGGAVTVAGAAGSFAPTQSYGILSAPGGVSGTFGSVVSDFSFLTPSLVYTANSVILTVDRNNSSFVSVGASQNHAAVAPVIEALGFGHPLHDVVVMLSETEARNAFDQLSGDTIQASASSALIEDSEALRDVVTSRIRDAFGGASSSAPAFGPEGQGDGGDPVADPYRYSAWGTAFGGFGESDGDGNAAGLDRSSFGFLAGGDALIAETWRLGFFGGYSRSSFDADERAASGDSSNFHLGTYGGTELGALALSFGGAYSWHDVETTRDVTIGGFTDRLTAEYDASTAQLFGEAGYGIDAGAATFEPFAGLAWVHLDTDAFAERGGPAALTGAGSANDVTFTTLGLRASTGFVIAGLPARARGAVAWRHAFGDVTPFSTHALAGSPAFTVAGTPIAEDALVLEAGLDLDLSDKATLGLGYDGQIGDGAHDHAFNGALKVRF